MSDLPLELAVPWIIIDLAVVFKTISLYIKRLFFLNKTIRENDLPGYPAANTLFILPVRRGCRGQHKIILWVGLIGDDTELWRWNPG